MSASLGSLSWHFLFTLFLIFCAHSCSVVLFPFDNIHTIPECIHHFCFECAAQQPLARQLLFDMYLFVFIIRSNNRHPSDWRDEKHHTMTKTREKKTHITFRKKANEDIMVPKHSSIKYYYSQLCCSIHQCSGNKNDSVWHSKKIETKGELLLKSSIVNF